MDFGAKAAVNPTSVYDFNATILHLMGLDHERLTYYHNGLKRRLTNVHGHVVKEVLACRDRGVRGRANDEIGHINWQYHHMIPVPLGGNLSCSSG